MHEHRITCEVCNKDTRKGIIKKDGAMRDRYFCSDKCLEIKLDEQKIKRIHRERNIYEKLKIWFSQSRAKVNK